MEQGSKRNREVRAMEEYMESGSKGNRRVKGIGSKTNIGIKRRGE